MEFLGWFFAFIGLVGIVSLFVVFIQERKGRRRLEHRFQHIVNAEEEAKRIIMSVEAKRAAVEEDTSRLKADAENLKKQYAAAFQRYQELESGVRGLEEDLRNIDVGLYKPHFTYEHSATYKVAILQIRDKQKSMIRAGQAAQCDTTWTVGGSKREGERMVKQYEKLILRAFNAEAEAAVANVTWNNIRVMKTRIEKAFDALNKLGTVMQISLNPRYRDARLEELQLVYEEAEKKQQEREEQRRLRAEQREEERVQRELARAKEDAEKDESKYEKALAKAREDMEKALGAERDLMLARIKELEVDLAEAHERKERAIAQAQLTKVGHVYVISNIGAFGEGVLKIGLTRRLDPRERIQELGDASVPFPFDLHALVYSENAPELERKLHERFWERRLNWANNRKEFFRVGLEEVNLQLSELGIQANIFDVPEAREYRETQAAVADSQRTMTADQAASVPGHRFPSDPFADIASVSGDTISSGA